MAGGIGGRAHLHGVADEARRSIPAQCMGLLCMACGQTRCALRVRRRELREAGQVRAGHKARGRAQQVCAAGAQQARAVPWAGREHTRARGASTWRFERGQRTFEFKIQRAFIQIVRSPLKSAQVPGAGRSGVLPVLPTAQRAPAARLPHTPAARATAHCCARRTPRQCSRLPSPHAHAHRSQACRASPCTGQGCSYVLPQRPHEGAPCHRSRLPRPPAASPPRI